jgi:hypothetical protein
MRARFGVLGGVLGWAVLAVALGATPATAWDRPGSAQGGYLMPPTRGMLMPPAGSYDPGPRGWYQPHGHGPHGTMQPRQRPGTDPRQEVRPRGVPALPPLR